MSAPTITRYRDPLRTNGQQAVIIAQLFCVNCGIDLSAPHKPGIIDLQTGDAFCCADHWRQGGNKKSG